MKKTLMFLGCITLVASSFAQEDVPVPSIHEQTTEIIKAATMYARSISCESGKIEPKDIAALVPFKDFNSQLEAKFAVLWHGDTGCQGGSGTDFSQIMIVTVGMGNRFLVDPTLSSPTAKFEIPVRFVDRLVGNTTDSLVLEGNEFGDNDSNCCPSVKIRFTM